MLQPNDLPSSLAWTFTNVLPGSFRRKKADYAHHDYPIIAPLPTDRSNTAPLEDAGRGPFIYFVISARGTICYLGKSCEISVLKRWIRPDNGRPAKHYWTHSTKEGGCVFKIAEGLRNDQGPFHLRYCTLLSLKALFKQRAIGLEFSSDTHDEAAISLFERWLISMLKPAWNK